VPCPLVATMSADTAKIGKRVQIKSSLRAKFPWRLEVGDHSWLGENVLIDNLDMVSIGANCCISQGGLSVHR
jgi:putative colanic acid biosynthesis acetyltransferase WcaF